MRGAEGLVLKEVGWAEPQRWHLRQRGGRRGAQGPRHTQGPVRTGTGEARLWPAVRGLVAPLLAEPLPAHPAPSFEVVLEASLPAGHPQALLEASGAAWHEVAKGCRMLVVLAHSAHRDGGQERGELSHPYTVTLLCSTSLWVPYR